MPTRVHPSSSGEARPWLGQGLVLAILYLVLATIVALCTYNLDRIANTPVQLGLQIHTFTYNQWNVPITTLLRSSTSVAPLTNDTYSLSDLLYKTCGTRDHACAAGFLNATNAIWGHVAKAFLTIPDFDQPRFQDPSQSVRIQHISNLNGWNKATAQFSMPGHDVAMTCMIRRASFRRRSAPASTPSTIDTLAFCSQRAFDPNWVCENDVAPSVNTYAIQVNQGKGVYVGVTPRHQVHFNPGAVATLTGNGTILLETVPSMDEYGAGILSMNAPWDVLTAGSCATFNEATGLGWFMKVQGLVTMTWKCDSLMLTNAMALWALTLDLTVMQIVYLRRSVICCGPVYMAKNVIGLVILLVAFYGNKNLQTLTTFLYISPSHDPGCFAHCGPAQLASIVGIMTGTLVQTWFNPRLVTQTWLLLLASLVNWILVFVLEAFVFPSLSHEVPGPCGSPTATNCIAFHMIERTHYLSAVASGVVIVVAIRSVQLDTKRSAARSVHAPIAPTHSLLTYLAVTDLASIVTSQRGLTKTVQRGGKDVVALDSGVLLIKSMVEVSRSAITRTSNLQLELIYRHLPFVWLQAYMNRAIGSMLVVHVKDHIILQRSSYQCLGDILAAREDEDADDDPIKSYLL
ncbi:hypothetical protein SPRG_00810 [Saprolegnia parasitica CBS 223.65]|uniref:Uncharacterized protein n=1 Tax=Saprolegnia parasitica (strain CBS 223.65) TaxID=695850 RepID=A0A067CVP0_SAPPC|nr:hypothetical protein SPRG_00810 [Saprolegnia parasitica CBS 223.65]KDO34749.1 hypothetical protein SPRG_00810 [Saprolegnia parasitica CBS 223.65]|eukprot:XP_012194416.1 hypothetical protein SPRG_00810 [Saprolegnia parasitica CBS 223.65]